MQTTPNPTHERIDIDPPTTQRLSKVIVATALVGGLEIFDFTIFGFFAATIGEQFFPSTDPMTSLLLAAGTFGVGFFMRPLGAISIGAYADRVGRRTAMTTTCWLMALGTAAIGFCPPFSAIGLAAPVIVVLARAVQGFAAGGELGAGASYLLEAGPVLRRGFRVSWQLAGQASAALLGAMLGVLLTSTLSPANLASWGWRIPFIVGLLVAPLAIYVRRQLREIPLPAATHATGATHVRHRAPLVELWRDHRSTLILATLTMIWHTVTVYVVVYYMPSYLMRVMHLPAAVGFRSAALSALLLAIVSPVSGLLADRLRRRKPLVLATSGATALFVVPVFMMITRAQGTLPLLLGVGAICVLVALGTSVNLLLVLEALPARVRASGLATSMAVAVALFGGTAQFVVTALIKWTGNPLSAAWYVALACATSFCAFVLFRERAHRG
ncbi:MFS transporter [Paraburkholderia sp.]|uniref:MFS transporter n=1 Tax=Paraburkholderia sp. TaxID=1926495 RepID=UPI003D6FB541